MNTSYMAAVQSLGLQKQKAVRGINRHFQGIGCTQDTDSSTQTGFGSRISVLKDTGSEGEKKAEETQENSQDRSEAKKIYEAAMAGKPNPLEELRKAPKVPYEHLAKDGVINYNGVCFICDEKTNSICLGDMTDEKNVLNIPLSGGGHLKVNRANLGELSKAASMFSPEDLNLIMRAIALDTKLQATQEEIDDIEANIGNQLTKESDT